MLETSPSSEFEAQPFRLHVATVSMPAVTTSGMEAFIRGLAEEGLPIRRRRIVARQHLLRAGQAATSLFLAHAGSYKSSITSDDGREKITGFPIRGDMLGMEALDLSAYAADVIALDVGEVWELPYAQLRDVPGFQTRLAMLMAGEIRRDWNWMLAIGTLSAEQRVIAFLLDLAARMEALGFSARSVLLRMSRAELGNFLALQLETVTRALSRLNSQGLITVERREIRIEDKQRLRELLTSGR